MRRIFLLIILCLCAVGAFAYNESVAAISYNPSRLGAYTYLKAVKSATLVGGVDTTSTDTKVNIRSKGTVELSQDHMPTNATTCTTGHCDQNNLHTIMNLKPATEAGELKGANGYNCSKSPNTCTSSTTQAEMTGAVVLHAYSQPYVNNYKIGSTSPIADQGTNVNLAGGSLTAQDDSYIREFAHDASANVNKLKVYASQLESGNFYVKGSFKLGNITIESPSGDNYKSYSFQEYTTDDNKTIQVLVADK